MSTGSRTVLKLVVGILLSVLFLYLAFRETNPGELYATVRSANYRWLVLMMVCLLASHAVRSLRWRYFLNPIKANIGMRNLFSGVIVGYMMNNVLPRAGELVRPYAISKLEKISTSAALGTIVVERLLDMLTFVLLIGIIPLVYQGPLRETFPWLERAGILVAGGTFCLLAGIGILMARRDWTDAVLKRVSSVLPQKLAGRINQLVHSFLDGFLFLKRPRQMTTILFLTILIWGLYLLMVYVALFAFPPLGGLGMDAAFVVLAISSIGVAIPTPGGTGTYHFFTTETLTRLYGIEHNLALSFATATHAAGFVTVTLLGLYFFMKDHIRVSEAVASVEKEG